MQKGFTLLEVIFLCFGISLTAALIIPNALEFFQRTTMFVETQRLHTNLRAVQNSNYNTAFKTDSVPFRLHIDNGKTFLKVNSENQYSLYEYDERYKIMERKLPPWLNIKDNVGGEIYFDQYGNLQGETAYKKSRTITLSRNNSQTIGEKYTVILHDKGRIRSDFKNAKGK